MDDIDLDDLFGEGENTLFDGMEDGFDLNEIGDEIMGSIDAGSRFGSEADGENNDEAKQPEENDVEEKEPTATTTTRSSSKKKNKSSKASKSKTKKDKNAGGNGTTKKNKKKRDNTSADGEMAATQEVPPEGEISPVAPESITKSEIKKKKKKKNKSKVLGVEVGVASSSMVSTVSKSSAFSSGEQLKIKTHTKFKAPPCSTSIVSGANMTKTKIKKPNKVSKRSSSIIASDAGHELDGVSTKRQAQDAIEDVNRSQQQLKELGINSTKKSHDRLSPTAAQKSNLHQLFDRQLKQQQLKTAPVQQGSASQQRPRPTLSLARHQSLSKSKLGQLTTDHSSSIGHADDSGSSATATALNFNGGSLEPSNSLFYPFCILPNDIHYGARKYAKTFPLIEQVYGVLVPGGHKRDDHFHQHETAASSAASAEQHNISEAKTTLNNLDLEEVAKELKEAHGILMRQRSFLDQSNDNMQQWCKIHFKQYDYSDIYRDADDRKINTVQASQLALPQSQESSHEQHTSKSSLDECTQSITTKPLSSSASYGSSHIPRKAGRSQWLRQYDFARSSSSLRNLCAEQSRTFCVKVKCTAFKPPFVINPFTQKKQKRFLSATIDLSAGRAQLQSEGEAQCSTGRAMPAMSSSDDDIMPFESPGPITSNASRALALPSLTDKQNPPQPDQDVKTAEENEAARKEVRRLCRRRRRDEEEQQDWISDYVKKRHHLEEHIHDENECGGNISESGTSSKILQEWFLTIDKFGGGFTAEEDESSDDDNTDLLEEKDTAIVRARGRKRELIQYGLHGLCEPELPLHPVWETHNTEFALFKSKKRRRGEIYDATKQLHGAGVNGIDRENGKLRRTIDRSEDFVKSENVANSKSGYPSATRKNSTRSSHTCEPSSSHGNMNGHAASANIDKYVQPLFDRLSSLLVDENGSSDSEDEDEDSSNTDYGTLDDQSGDDDLSVGSGIEAVENTPQLIATQLTLDERTYIQLRSTNMINSHSGAQNDDEAGDCDHVHYNSNSNKLLHDHDVDYEVNNSDGSALNPVSLCYQIELLKREHSILQRSIGQCAGFLQSEACTHVDQLQAEAISKQAQRRIARTPHVARVSNHRLTAKEEREGGKLATMNHRSGLDRVPKSLL